MYCMCCVIDHLHSWHEVYLCVDILFAVIVMSLCMLVRDNTTIKLL